MQSPFDVTPVEDLGHGVSLQMLHDGQITAFTLTSIARKAIDDWADKQISVLANWTSDRPFATLLDQSAFSGLTLTPYMKCRLAEVSEASVGKSGYVAVVVGKSFMLKLVTLFLRSQKSGDVETRFFTDRNKALEWLEEIIPT